MKIQIFKLVAVNIVESVEKLTGNDFLHSRKLQSYRAMEINVN